jgi:endonuclease/exonuclease/phosphatase family metal-dependent hydrolase
MATRNLSYLVRPRLAACLAALLLATHASAQIRVVDYNTAGSGRESLGTVLSAIGAESVNGIAKPPDIFTLQEQESSESTTQNIVDVLNRIYGVGVYARATLDGGTANAGRPGLIYNSQTVELLAQSVASTVSTTGAQRQTLRYQLRPVGYDSTADFFVYSSHYKSSDGSANAARRNVEAQEVRANADALGSAHLIYAGDFNIYRSTEAMYQTLTAPGEGQAFDPIDRPGVWHDNAAFLDIHTQAPTTTARYPRQVTGGMDDRFDFQLVSAEFLDNEGLSYIGGSYRAFGNTGTHLLNGEITSGSAAALQARLPGYTLGQAAAVLEALASASDHLPVVADYQLPAKMSVQVGEVPARVIRDASVAVVIAVSNTAAVVAVAGADELDYVLSTRGSLSGSAAAMDAALGTANIHSLALSTDTVGSVTGFVDVQSDSQAAADKDFTRELSFMVLDHAKPFFTGQGEALSLTLDFGSVEPGNRSEPRTFSLANAPSSLGFTAGLDLDQITPSGAFDAFELNLTKFVALAPGMNLDFTALFEPIRPGAFEARYDLFFSDEDLPGASDLRTLQLRLIGTAIPEPGSATLLLIGLLGNIMRRTRRNCRLPV